MDLEGCIERLQMRGMGIGVCIVCVFVWGIVGGIMDGLGDVRKLGFMFVVPFSTVTWRVGSFVSE